ncbi:MAG: hypothetical protein WC503_00870 [Candidatus Shapirobacteria bacterium]
MAGYIGKVKLDKEIVEGFLLIEQDERYDEYYAMKIDDELYHVYGVNLPRFITRLDNYNLEQYIEKVPNGLL